MIKCDICGHELEIDQDGMAHCKQCGMNYTVEAIRKKYQENNKKYVKIETSNYVCLKVIKIQTSIFSKVPTLIAKVQEGELKSREILCIKGTKGSSYRVEWVQEYSGDAVRFQLQDTNKRCLKSAIY